MSGMTTYKPVSETCGYMVWGHNRQTQHKHRQYRCGAPAVGSMRALGPGRPDKLPRCAKHLRAEDPEPGTKEAR